MDKKKKKSLYDYKLGEICNEDMEGGLLEAPIELVCIGYTFQDKNGTQMTSNLKTENFEENIQGNT